MKAMTASLRCPRQLRERDLTIRSECITIENAEDAPMDRVAIAFISTALMLCAAPSSAADADAGKQKAEPCMSCHFSDDFAGKTQEEVMSLIAAERKQVPSGQHPPVFDGLSEDDLADIAAYFARGE
jgi:cytochrome c553